MRKILGFSLGFIGFLLPFILKFDGLSFAGHIGLSIFLLAAMFWLFEPIPIYGTSLLVISLGVLLLSSQGLLYMNSSLPTTDLIKKGNNIYQIPRKALTNKNEIYLINDKKETTPIKVEIVEENESSVIIKAENLSSTKICSNVEHKLVGYKPNSYTEYFYSLANSIIMLFLGGLLLADAATKYNLDKNITRAILKPFGYKPSMITLGLLSVTAIVSAFMSNTAATAMMMTVVLPIIAQLEFDDPFKKAVVLAIPFGANLGGIATPVGTPPNAVVLAALSKQNIFIPFGTWIALALPLVIIMVLFAWWLMLKTFPPKIDKFELKMTGSFDKSSKAITLYVIFIITVLLWTTEALHGISANMVAFFTVTALVITNVVDVKDIRNIPWEVLWLVAGGIAMDIIMRNTGLGNWLVSRVAWTHLGSMGVLTAFALVGIILSTFLSHTVTATILAPLAVGIGVAGNLGEGFSVSLGAVVLGIATSFAMALPISTPPNAIAVSTGLIDTKGMLKVGLPIGIVGIILMLIFAKFYWPLILN